jgi:hemerythrin-like domain-containing protein
VQRAAKSPSAGRSAAKKPRAKTSSGGKSSPKKAAARQTMRRAGRDDALALLEKDHRKVQKMFKQFEKLDHEDERATRELAEQAISELEVHAALEEELFYPVVRDSIDEEDVIEEAEVEHQSARDLIDRLRALQPGTPTYAATFKVLGEYVNHHIEEEEKQMFKLAKRAKLDFEELGQELRQRKEEILSGRAAEMPQPTPLTQREEGAGAMEGERDRSMSGGMGGGTGTGMDERTQRGRSVV